MTYSGSFQSPPGNYIADSDDFTPPTFGGAVAVKYGDFTYEDITSLTLFTLPAGAVPLDWWLDVETDFDAGTNNNVDIGAAADADYFAADLAIGTQGLFRNGATNSVRGRVGVRFEEDTAITIIYKPSGTAAENGEGRFFMTYITK